MELRPIRALMKYATAGAFLLLIAGAASADDFPKGTFSTEQNGTEWSIKFDDGGKFTVSRADEPVVEGKFKVTKDEIELSEETGPRADQGAKPGKYTWKLDGKKLTFTKVEDESIGRVRALTTGLWTRKD
jgi:hypothetical protein